MPRRPTFTTILLVRHGRTDSTGTILPGRAPGLHLSDAGTAQAAAVGVRLGELARRPAAVYTSPLERTRETAAALSRRPEWRSVQNSPSAFRFPSGESFTEMQLRMWTTLERLAGAHRNKTIVAVSHADPIKAAVTYAQGVPLDLFQRTVISPCSVSVLVLTDGAPIVLAVNSLGTLRELAPS